MTFETLGAVTYLPTPTICVVSLGDNTCVPLPATLAAVAQTSESVYLCTYHISETTVNAQNAEGDIDLEVGSGLWKKLQGLYKVTCSVYATLKNMGIRGSPVADILLAYDNSQKMLMRKHKQKMRMKQWSEFQTKRHAKIVECFEMWKACKGRKRQAIPSPVDPQTKDRSSSEPRLGQS